MIVSRNLHGSVSEQAAQPTQQRRSLTGRTRPTGVKGRRVARVREPGPLAYLLGLGFLQPAKKCGLAAGHRELLTIVRPHVGRCGYHRVPSNAVRSFTLGKKITLP